jgi:hypothetical protein
MVAEPTYKPSESDPTATYAIGRFIFEFSQLEFCLRYHTGTEAGLEGKNFTAIMTQDFALLCTAAIDVLGRSLREDDNKRVLKEIISECRKLNDVRVKVAHGLWVPFHEGGTVQHVSRSSLKISVNVEQAKQLEQYADQANHLWKTLEEIMWDDLAPGIAPRPPDVAAAVLTCATIDQAAAVIAAALLAEEADLTHSTRPFSLPARNRKRLNARPEPRWFEFAKCWQAETYLATKNDITRLWLQYTLYQSQDKVR